MSIRNQYNPAEGSDEPLVWGNCSVISNVLQNSADKAMEMSTPRNIPIYYCRKKSIVLCAHFGLAKSILDALEDILQVRLDHSVVHLSPLPPAGGKAAVVHQPHVRMSCELADCWTLPVRRPNSRLEATSEPFAAYAGGQASASIRRVARVHPGQ
jgi:hypothetical protein